jgi:hypothetical protein
MHEELSPSNSYFRFFSNSPLAPEREAQRLCRPEDDQHAALLVRLDGRLVGEVAELDLNPMIARPNGAHIVDVRVRIAPAAPRDPFLRQLR